jgi:hypothetical protein
MTNAAMNHTSATTGSRRGQCQIETSLRVNKQGLEITEPTEALPAGLKAAMAKTFNCFWTCANHAGRC